MNRPVAVIKVNMERFVSQVDGLHDAEIHALVPRTRSGNGVSDVQGGGSSVKGSTEARWRGALPFLRHCRCSVAPCVTVRRVARRADEKENRQGNFPLFI